MDETSSASKASDALLAADVEGASLLLSYACQSDIEVAAETAVIVTRAKELFAEGKLVGDELASFYMAMQKLSVKAAPVTVAGLRAATATHNGRAGSVFSHGGLPESRQAIRWYWLWTVFWLIVLVGFQIYWVIGSTALTSLKQLDEERNKARYELIDLRTKLPRGTAPESTANGVKLTEAIENSRNRAVAYTQILSSWNKVLPFGLPNFADEPQARPEEGAGEPNSDLGTSRMDLILTRTPFILFALQAYVLPLLYGLLGSCTYVLRILSKDVRSFSYTPDSHIRYKIRMVLGTLSGLAITWFFEPGADSIKSLSPLALAFVAGYSVEILFAAMDRFVLAFSSAANGDQAGSKDGAQKQSG